MESKNGSEIEFDLDTENPYEVRLIIKSKFAMTGNDLYDALHCLVHEILEPELERDPSSPKEIGH